MIRYTFDGRGLRRRRLETGLRLTDLARVVGRSVPCLVKYQSADLLPSMGVLLRLSAALGCAPGDLFIRSDDEGRELVST